MSATVIIPTTGAPEVKTAIESVINQTYPTTCYVVVDGPAFLHETNSILKKYVDSIIVCYLPFNVGARGFYGHRIYAAFTHLLDTEYVMYLDQDNWMDPDHVQTCIDTIKQNNLDWCHSLRKIYDKDGQYVCRDDCESLGKWKTYHGMNHVDTNTYCIKTEIAVKLAQAWHGGWGQDRVFLSAMSQHFPNFDCSGKYTLNYRVDGGGGSVTADFFTNGNRIMNEKYNGEFPWNKNKISSSGVSRDTILIRSNLG
jgi:glycosyltransferase involved in cell wall biosynthesis